MKDDIIERDPELGALLGGVSGEAPVEEVDWAALRSGIETRTVAMVQRRRAARLRWRAFMGTAMAASVAMLFMVSRAANVGRGGGTFAEGTPTLEKILETDASDEEVRALLSGAGDADLLLLAASDSE